MDDALNGRLKKIGCDAELIKRISADPSRTDFLNLFGTVFQKYDPEMGWDATSISEAISSKNLLRNLRILELGHYVSSVEDLDKKNKRSKVLRAVESLLEKVETKHHGKLPSGKAHSLHNSNSKGKGEGGNSASAKKHAPVKRDTLPSQNVVHALNFEAAENPFQPRASRIMRTPTKNSSSSASGASDAPRTPGREQVEPVRPGRSLARTPIQAPASASASAPAPSSSSSSSAAVTSSTLQNYQPLQSQNSSSVPMTDVPTSTAGFAMQSSSMNAPKTPVSAKKPPRAVRTPSRLDKENAPPATPQPVAKVRLAGERLARTPNAKSASQQMFPDSMDVPASPPAPSAPVLSVPASHDFPASPAIQKHPGSLDEVAVANENAEHHLYIQEIRETERIRQLEEELTLVAKQLKNSKEQEELLLHKASKVDAEIAELKSSYNLAVAAITKTGSSIDKPAETQMAMQKEIDDLEYRMQSMKREMDDKECAVREQIHRTQELIKAKQYELSVLETGVHSKANAFELIRDDCDTRRTEIEDREMKRLANARAVLVTALREKEAFDQRLEQLHANRKRLRSDENPEFVQFAKRIRMYVDRANMLSGTRSLVQQLARQAGVATY
eukprot:ANDGO_03140.mRNA.1 hypothetical protein